MNRCQTGFKLARILASLFMVLSLPGLAAGCRSEPRNDNAAPGPLAQRPEIRSEAEFAAERAERIESGQVVVNEPPTLATAAATEPATSRPSPPARPGPGAVRPDILLVDGEVLTVDEVLYALRDRVAELRGQRTRRGFLEELDRMVRVQVQQDVGLLLVYQRAAGELEERGKQALEEFLEREVATRIDYEFGGSRARFEAHLAQFGLSLTQYRDWIKHRMVAQQYVRERLLERVHLRHEELLRFYETHLDSFTKPETRELLMIEVPFERFLTEGTRWATATEDARAQARLRARRHVLLADEALQTKPFGDVAREFSLGRQAAAGGSWGEIGRPLQAPYTELSERVFSFTDGQRSEPIETPTGWYIVACGGIQPYERKTFEAVQDEIRRKLTDERFNTLAAEYIVDLAQRATISSLDEFIEAALRRASRNDWPPPPPATMPTAGT